MAAVALDLTPTIDRLLDHPFDSTALQHAHADVKGHPHAYATALRCAAKRTENPLAAAYWLTEAARVHESVDDLGGAIALLSRAWECDQTNARTRELLAGCMARLSVRVGLGFAAAPPTVRDAPAADASLNPPPVESGLRPPPMDATDPIVRDTLPGLFGLEVLGADGRPPPSDLSDSIPAVDVEPPKDEAPKAEPDPEAASVLRAVASLATGAGPEAASGARKRRDALFPPPPGPERESEPAAVALVLAKPDVDRAPAALAKEPVGTPTLRSSDTIHYPKTERDPGPELPNEEPYDDVNRMPTMRPAGDGLVGAVFEALHELHFVQDVKEGAHFVRRVVQEKMRPAIVLVHLYDINSRHFVVVSAFGSRAEVLTDYATPDDDPLAAEIMRGEEAMLVLDPASDPRLSRGRWRLAEPKKSVLCAPVAVEGRYLGLLEIADPMDGSEFTENDRNVLTYVANAFAKYLDGRGVVFDGDVELDSAVAW